MDFATTFTFVIVIILTDTWIGSTLPVNKKRLHNVGQRRGRVSISPFHHRSSFDFNLALSKWRLSKQPRVIYSTRPSLTHRAFLYSKTGYFLRIPFSGKINGTLDRNSKYARLIMESVGTSEVRIKGEFTNNYLAMDRNGYLYPSKTLNSECVFKETMERTDFHTYVSHKYSGLNPMNLAREWYLAIKRNGKAKHALNTSKRQKATQFMVVPIKDKNS